MIGDRLSSRFRNISPFIIVGIIYSATWGLYVLKAVSYDTALEITLTTGVYALLLKLLNFLLHTRSNGPELRLTEEERTFKHDWLVATASYGIITVVFFYPVIETISSALIGPPEDNLKYLWNMWWGGNAIFGDASLAFSEQIFYPEGGSLLYNDYSWYNLGLSIVLKPIFNPATIYNLLVLHTFVLSGLGGFLLTKYFTKDSWVSLIGGFIFAFNPSHFAHSLHHINIASIQFIPFFVLFFIKSVKNGSHRNLALACLFFLLSALCDWNYLIFNCFFIGLSYAYLAISRRRFVLPEVLKKSAIVVATTLILLSPWLMQMISAGAQHPEVSATGHNIFVADLAALVVPHANHVFSDVDLFETVNSSVTGNPWESTVYLGIINVFLLIVIFWRRTRVTTKFICGIIPFTLLSMGSYVHFMGRELPVMLPYRLFELIPFLSQARNPSRFIVFVYLFLGVAVAFALKYLYQSLDRRKVRSLVLGTTSVLVFIAFFSICDVTSEVTLPHCYEVIKQDTDRFGILDVPTSWKGNAAYMMYQTMHEIPIVQGLVPRKVGTSLINDLEFEDIEKRKQQLIDSHVKYIVLHKELLGAQTATAIRYHEQAFENIYSDAGQVVFQVY